MPKHRVTQPHQAAASKKKQDRRKQRHTADQEEANRLNISVAQLRQQREAQTMQRQAALRNAGVLAPPVVYLSGSMGRVTPHF